MPNFRCSDECSGSPRMPNFRRKHVLRSGTGLKEGLMQHSGDMRSRQDNGLVPSKQRAEVYLRDPSAQSLPPFRKLLLLPCA